MSTPCAANVLIGAVRWHNYLGICTDFTWSYVKQQVAIKDEGSVTTDCLADAGRDLIADVTFLENVPVDGDPIPGADVGYDLTIYQVSAGGVNTVTTLPTMALVTCGEAFNRDAPPAAYKATFRYLATSINTIAIPVAV